MTFQVAELNRGTMNKSGETEGTNIRNDSSRRTLGCRTAAMAAIILIAVLASAISAYSTTNPTSSMQTVNGTLSQSAGGSVTVTTVSSQSQQATTLITTTEAAGSMYVSSASQATTSTMQSQASNSVSTIQVTTTSSPQTATQATTTNVVQTVTTSAAPQNCGGNGCDSHSYPSPYPPSYPGYPGYYPAYPGYYPGYPAYTVAYASCSYATPSSNSVQCYGYVYQAPTGCVELVVQVTNPYYGTSALQYYTLHNLSSIPPSGILVVVAGQMYQGYNTSSTGAGCPGNYINVSSVTPL